VLYPSAALTLYWICGPQIVASYYFTNAPSGWVKRFHHWGNAPLSFLFLLSGTRPITSTQRYSPTRKRNLKGLNRSP
jgi:hypothetical protein